MHFRPLHDRIVVRRDSSADWAVRIMESFPHFVLGVLGTLALAIFLVLCSASALQTWQSIHQPHPWSMAVNDRSVPIW